MKKIAMIKNNIVENITIVEDNSSWAPVGFDLVDITNLPDIYMGSSYINGVFTPPIDQNQPVIILPVTPRQFRQALVLSGVDIAVIESAIDQLSEPTRSLAKIEWEYSTAFLRSNALVNQMGPSLGFDSEALDNLWLLAGSL